MDQRESEASRRDLRCQEDLRATIDKYIGMGFEITHREPITLRRGVVEIVEHKGLLLHPSSFPRDALFV